MINILLCTNIEKELCIDNFVINKNRNTAKLINTNFTFVSLHDLKFQDVLNEEHENYIKNELIEKYIRRHQRFIEKLNNNEKLLFNYCGKHNDFDDYQNQFFETIMKINKKNYLLVLLNSEKNNKNQEIYEKINKNIFIINLINISKNIDGVDLRHCNLIEKNILFDTIYQIYIEN